ncbi:hypothetical protein HHI36_019215 [Cryptolaemus montrouzieri]|uniref:N-acetyltransferase domain-containing protein n=1 Tax=Cryptolaemus montrouzieri TaxID=559131 RepID=A0ABD2P269_9CUCU
MRLNEDTKIIGNSVILVPYMQKHVPKYHAWMQSEDLRKLTASEPLTLEEEYAMQRSWLLDEDKCTFIILDKEIFTNTNNEVTSMIGDTNLFFESSNSRLCAEAEIMIAEDSSRGKKKGWEAMLHMLLYGIKYIHVKQFVVKISTSNKISINMFLKMDFIQTNISEIFDEVTLEKIVDAKWIEWIETQLPVHEVMNDYLDGDI